MRAPSSRIGASLGASDDAVARRAGHARRMLLRKRMLRGRVVANDETPRVRPPRLKSRTGPATSPSTATRATTARRASAGSTSRNSAGTRTAGGGGGGTAATRTESRAESPSVANAAVARSDGFLPTRTRTRARTTRRRSKTKTSARGASSRPTSATATAKTAYASVTKTRFCRTTRRAASTPRVVLTRRATKASTLLIRASQKKLRGVGSRRRRGSTSGSLVAILVTSRGSS